MMTLKNILKKGLSLCFVSMAICLLPAEKSLAQNYSGCVGKYQSQMSGNHGQRAGSFECATDHCATTPTNKTEVLKTLQSKSSGNCLDQMPIEKNAGLNISAVVGVRTDTKALGGGNKKATNADGTRNHEGMDVGTAGRTGVHIYAPAQGEVTNVNAPRTSAGCSGVSSITLKHKRSSENSKQKGCDYYETKFLHVVNPQVKQGKIIGKQTWIADAGPCTGYAIHMHYEIRDCDGTLYNPTCISGGEGDPQQLCDGTQNVLPPANDPASYNGPESNNSDSDRNPNLDKVKDCSQITTAADKKECETRNQKIKEGGIYCPPGKGYNKKQDTSSTKEETSCKITKNTAGQNIRKDVNEAIAVASEKFGIPATLLAAMIQQESSFNPMAKAYDGGQGTVQFQPSTWAQYTTNKAHLVREPYCLTKLKRDGKSPSECVSTKKNNKGKYIQDKANLQNNQYVWVEGNNKCSELLGKQLQPSDVYNPYYNIMCGALLFQDSKNNTKLGGDMSCIIVAHNRGAGGASKYKNNHNGTCSSADYYKKIMNHQKALATKNQCSVNDISSGGVDLSECESFTSPVSTEPSGGGVGAADSGGAYGVAKYESNYKCSISEYHSSIKGCMFCKLFEVIFNTSSQIADKSHTLFSKSMISLLAVGLAIALAWTIMRYVSDMTVKDPGMLLNDIFRKIFLIAFLILLLKVDVVNLFNMFVTPIFEAGFKLAETIILNSSVELTTDTPWNKLDGSGLPEALGYSMLRAIYAIQARLEQLLALGSNSICIALYVKSYAGWPIFPHFGYLITGIFLWITAVVFMLAYPFLLIDSVLQFTIASSLLPVGIAATGFKITYKYINIFKIINIFMTAMFVFIFLTIVMFILLAGMDQIVIEDIRHAYDESAQSNYFSLSELGWFTEKFIKLVFFLFLGKTVLEDIPNFAEDYAKTFSAGESGGKADMGIGRTVGGYYAQGLMGVAKLGGKGVKAVGGEALDLTGKGLKAAGSYASSKFVAGRHNYLVNHTMKKAAAATGGTGLDTTVTGRNWWGQKVTRKVTQNPDGSYSLESKRKSLVRRRDVVKLEDNNISIRKKISKDGTTTELYKMKDSLAKKLINKDGTINQKALQELRQNSNLPKEEINKAILHQLIKQRIPDAGAKIGFKWGWPPVSRTKSSLEGTFVSEQINSYKDKNGNEVFEVRRVGKDGNTNVFKMTEGKKRTLVEYERITKNGKSTKLSSDGVLQKKEQGRYDLNPDGTIKNELQVDSNVLINGAEVANAQIDANGVIKDASGNVLGKIQANGNVVDGSGHTIGTATAPDLIFDASGRALGKMTAEGTVVDARGNIKGAVTQNGAILDGAGNQIGQVPPAQRDALMAGIKPKYTKSKVEFSHSQAYKYHVHYDEHGNKVDGLSIDAMRDEGVMFDDDSITMYQEQMRLYGDVINHHAFGK